MNADRLLRAFSNIGEEPGRIQQIRQIAVSLAISGKLGDAGSGQTPAEMIAAIESVKADLAKRHIISKPKKYGSVLEESLPEGFQGPDRFVALGTIARVEKGLTGIKQAEIGPFPLVVTGAQRSTCDHFDFDGAAAIIPLVSSTGHGHASLNRLHYQEGKFALGSILAAVFPYDPKLISARFLFEYLSAFKDELLITRMTGTANVTLTLGRIAEVPVPLVDPIAQQKVDEMMTLLDRLAAAGELREATRDRLTTASLARLTSPDTTPEEFPSLARFALEALPALTTRADQIKALRQTILNLAVRGKLVEQDPADEPALELLKRVAAEKAASGKRQKEIPEIDADELGELPASWSAAPLIALGEWAIGSGFPKNEQGQTDGPYFFLKVSDMNLPENEKFITTANNWIDEAAAKRMRAAIHPAGTIIFPKIGGAIATNKRRILTRESAIDNNCLGINFSSHIDTDWAYLLLTTLDFTLYQAGTAVPALQQGTLAAIPIALPPFAEQQRIVAKVDALMALCGRLEAALGAADTSRSRLLEYLLHEALTPASVPELEAAE